MRKTAFTEEQVAHALRQAESGTTCIGSTVPTAVIVPLTAADDGALEACAWPALSVTTAPTTRESPARPLKASSKGRFAVRVELEPALL